MIQISVYADMRVEWMDGGGPVKNRMLAGFLFILNTKRIIVMLSTN